MEVGDLHLYVHNGLAWSGVGQPAHVDLQVAVASATASGDEQAALDSPAHHRVLAVHLVFRRLEREQLQRARE